MSQRILNMQSWSKSPHTTEEAHPQRTLHETSTPQGKHLNQGNSETPQRPHPHVFYLPLSQPRPWRTGRLCRTEWGRRAEMKATWPRSAAGFQDKVSLELREQRLGRWRMGVLTEIKMDFLITEYETQNRWQILRSQTGDAEERAHRTGLEGVLGETLFPDGPAYCLMCETLCCLLYVFSLRQGDIWKDA